MKRIALFLVLWITLPGFGLTVAEKGKSNYQIVVPDSSGDFHLDGYVELGGKVIKTAVFKAAGARISVVKESQMIPGKPAIFVGNTRALKKAGLSSEKFALWEHSIVVKGKNIFIYGKDEANTLKKVKYPRYFVHYVNGSLKAACTFVERFVNTRFVGTRYNSYGEHDGVRTLPQQKIAVPEGFAYRKIPRFRITPNDMGGVLYCAANNFLFEPAAEYRVHYHTFAIPQKKYYKSNPEYFALIGGKRYFHAQDGGSRPQYCLSNPEVQKLIYEEARSRVAAGLKVIELGQSDGFKGCSCSKCKAWHNTSDWGEKLWIFHRDMAEKLQKEFPGITVAIAAYEPTHQLPRSFKKFPGKGVVIDLAPATPELIKGFSTYNIQGIAAWTYYFGCYKACGYSPANPFSLLQKEARWLNKSAVTIFYHCGLGSAPALTGPWGYIWGRLLENPELDVKKELADYCLFAFGAQAAPHFYKFFTLLDQRMEKFPLARLKIEGGYDPARGDDFSGPPPQYAIELWNQRYPEKIIAELDRHFFAGVRAAGKSNYMVENLKTEYQYMRLSAAVCHAVKTMEKANTFANRCKLADRIEAREKFLKALPRRQREPLRIEGQAFYGHNINLLRNGGFMYGVFRGAFHSAPEVLRINVKNIELVQVKDFNDPQWNKIPEQNLLPVKRGSPVVKSSFKAAFTDKALLFKFKAPAIEGAASTKLRRDDMRLWNNSLWELFITTTRDIRQFSFSAVTGSCYDSIIYPEKYRRKSNSSWNPVWQHKDRIINGVWLSEVTIPFAAVGGFPGNGELRQMQVGFSTPGARHIYAWNISLTGAFRDITGFGGIRFGKRKNSREKFVKLDTDFIPLANNKGYFKNWVANPGNLPMSKEKNALKLKADVKNYLGLYTRHYFPLESDETAEITLKVRGHGKAYLALGFFDNAGNWIVNKSSQSFPLTAKEGVYTFKFRSDEYVAKGAAQFQIVVFLQKPGGTLLLDDMKLKIKR